MSSYMYERGEFRLTEEWDTKQNETIVFEEGYTKDSLDRGFFCKVSKRGFCVEDFGTTKRSALRKARKAWIKLNAEGYQREFGYPRVVSCED